jgi:VanZ family protein
MHSRSFLLGTIAVIGVILHGSLYPYDFRVPASGVGPLAALLDSWADPPSSFGDLGANILLYVPLGFLGALTMRGGWRRRLCVMSLAGLLLSVGVELAQFYDPGRVTNMSDVYLNTFGATLGAAAAILFGGLPRYPLMSTTAAPPVPVLLLTAMLGYHLFPYVPTIDLHKYWHSVRAIILAPDAPPDQVLHYLALWLTTSCLIGAITGYRRSRVLVPFFIACVFMGKILIESLVLSLPEIIGAALAFALWLVVGGSRRAAILLAAAVLAAAIVVERLQPFEFQATARAFGWLPFRGFLGGSIEVNTMSFLEKFFLYGSLVWLATEAGLRLWLATLLTASLLLITSVAETYIPGRSAEITDALMAVMIGLIMAPMREPRPDPRADTKAAAGLARRV